MCELQGEARTTFIYLYTSLYCFFHMVWCVIYQGYNQQRRGGKVDKKKWLQVQLPACRFCVCRLPSRYNKLLTHPEKEASSNGLLNRKESHVCPVICYSVNRISGEMDLLACPLRRDEGQPLPWRCHLQHDTIVNTQLWEKRAEKHSYPFGILVMERDEGWRD